MIIRSLGVASILTMLAGCTTTPEQFEQGMSARIRVGMSKADVIKSLSNDGFVCSPTSKQICTDAERQMYFKMGWDVVAFCDSNVTTHIRCVEPRPTLSLMEFPKAVRIWTDRDPTIISRFEIQSQPPSNQMRTSTQSLTVQ